MLAEDKRTPTRLDSQAGVESFCFFGEAILCISATRLARSVRGQTLVVFRDSDVNSMTNLILFKPKT